MTSDTQAEFEYVTKVHETIFETFLRYTNEKEVSSNHLAKILKTIPESNSLKILDIGAGNGEYLKLSLQKSLINVPVDITLVEPSLDLLKQVPASVEFSPKANVTTVPKRFEEYKSKEKYDVILASHVLYHMERPYWTSYLAKMISLLDAGGALIIIHREKDDIYNFKNTFKPLLFSDKYKASDIDDVMREIKHLPNMTHMSIRNSTAISKTTIPVSSNKEDAVSIVEFYVNKRWQDIPKTIQRQIWQFINARNNIFEQRDGFIVIKDGTSKH